MSAMSRSLLLLATCLGLAAPRAAHADGTITGTVDAKPAKFLKNTIVYVKKLPTAHTTPATVKMDQQGMKFVPHILTIAVGDTVTFENDDPVTHNVMSPDAGYDLGDWGKGQTRSHKFTKPGVYAQVCKLHPEMLAYIFVGQNRLATAVDAQGKFTLNGVPAGTYELDVWDPKLKAPAQKVVVRATGATTVHFAIKR